MRRESRTPFNVTVIVLLTVFMLAVGLGCLILLPGPIGDIAHGRPTHDFGAARRIPAWLAVIGLPIGALGGLSQAWSNVRWLWTGTTARDRG